MCSWCEKETEVEPMVSGASIPMVCVSCGTAQGRYDYKDFMRVMRDYRILKNAIRDLHELSTTFK